MKRNAKRFYKDSALLSKRKAHNKVYVSSGCGYSLDTIITNRTELCIDELAYICVKAHKGLFYFLHQIKDEDIKEFENDERYCYCDLSIYGLDNGFLLIENLKAFDVEIHS